MTMKISLPEAFSAFVEAQVAGGHYATPDNVFRDALRLMERHAKAKAESVAWLQQAYREGIESGFVDGSPDFEAIKTEGRKRLEKSVR
ncbi:MAG: type II toxin-antitoxin system ParD family antitoxin [Tardiphaga sp.]